MQTSGMLHYQKHRWPCTVSGKMTTSAVCCGSPDPSDMSLLLWVVVRCSGIYFVVASPRCIRVTDMLIAGALQLLGQAPA